MSDFPGIGQIGPIELRTQDSIRESVDHFSEQMARSMMFSRKRGIRAYALKQAVKTNIENGLFVEFGVAAGQGCRQFGKLLGRSGKELTGFDSFEGLEEDWTGIDTGRQAGAFSQGGALPDVPANVTLVKGWIQDTLPGYLKETGPAPFSFVHMDMDTYTPTIFSLKAIKKRLVKGTIILFDELYCYPGWKEHEYKALQEVLDPSTYEYIAFSGQPVAIQLTKKP